MKCQYTLIFLLLCGCAKENGKTLHVTGQFSAYKSVEIKPLVQGTLLSIHFEDGQMVEEGDLLFTIDPKPYEIALELASSARADNISKLQYAAEKVDRYKTLLENKYVFEIDFIHYKSELTSLEAILMQNEADIRLAKLNLDNCMVRSPIKGLTSKHFIDEGNQLQKNETPLLQITQIDPIYIDFTLTEKEYLTLLASPNYEIQIANTDEKATLTYIDNQVDPDQNRRSLRALLQSPEHKFLPGQTVNLSIK